MATFSKEQYLKRYLSPVSKKKNKRKKAVSSKKCVIGTLSHFNMIVIEVDYINNNLLILMCDILLLLVSSGCLTGSWSVWSHAVTPHSTIYHLVFVI